MPLPLTPDPDAELVARSRAGDQAAVTELYRRHSQRGYNLALRMTGDPWDAADVAQEAFIKAFSHLSSFKGEARFSTWLHRIVVNCVHDHLRRRRPDPMEDVMLEHLSAPSSRGGSSLTVASVSPAEDGLSTEVKSALAALPEGFRLAIVLCDLLGYGYAEAAEILEVQEGTIKSRVFRARAELAESLRGAGFYPGGHGNHGPESAVSPADPTHQDPDLSSRPRPHDRREKRADAV
ncbi:MAG TPA: sigma-70 family RNA polymerase sigma factor [Thermoleophilia bacterium]|nr:sigma-70 family RNA polymerase sigma factor [Thermoleophilia bacterium]